MALAILAAGALVAGLGVSAALGHEEVFFAKPTASTDEMTTSEGIRGAAGIALQAGDLTVDRDISLSPSATRSLPVPGLSVDRDLGTGKTGLPFSADVTLAFTSGSHISRQAGDGDASTQSAVISTLASAAPAATLAAVAFAGAGLLVYFWASVKTFAYKALVLPLVPLYAHITRSEVFDNRVRESIFGLIRDEPGVSASELSRRSGVSWGTTVYHLEVLEQTKMVSSIRDGRYRRYFQNGAGLHATKEAVSVMKNDTTSGVVAAITAAPGTTQKELAAAVGMSPQALHWHLVRLVKVGVIEKRRDGRVVRHFAVG